jgi:flavin reductase (DIM6/NTAB) family NADH-FMN oxidoreductase RutF
MEVEMKISLGPRTTAYPSPVWIIGTYDNNGKPNMAAVAWGGICCSQPPCAAISLRKATYTFGCIMGKKAYTINIPSVKYIKEADYAGIASGRDTNKFADTGLTAVKSSLVDAPYIEEFPVIIECKLLHTFEIGLHTQFVGEIMDVKADESVVGEKGMPDILKIKSLVYDHGTTGYYNIGGFAGKAFSIGKPLK